MKLDFDSLYNECKRDVFAAGKQVFYDDSVKRLLKQDEEGKTAITAMVKDGGFKNVRIVFDETGGLYEYSCDCGESSHENGPCKHIIGTALSYEEKHPSEEKDASVPEKKSDADVGNLVYAYNKKRRKNVGGDEVYKAELTPYITFGKVGELSFTVGHRKQYVVKDVAGFIADFNECKYRKYGVALELYHNEGSFSEQSNKLIKFVAKCLAEKGPDYQTKTPAVLPLTGAELDKFFSLYEGKLVGKTRSEHWAFTTTDAALPIAITVCPASDGYLVKMNCFDVYYVHGMDYAYAVIGTRVFRMSEEQCSMICDLTDALKGGREMFVSADDMVQFYNSVLRKAAAYLPVNGENVNLEQFTVPTLGCKIYLKCEDKCVFAEVKACYGDEEFDILNDGFVTGHLRDWDSEDDIRTLLNKYFPQYPELVLAEESDIFEFLKRGVRELASYAEIFMSESMSKYRMRPVGKVRVGVRLHSDILSVAPVAEGLSGEEMKKIKGD